MNKKLLVEGTGYGAASNTNQQQITLELISDTALPIIERAFMVYGVRTIP